MNNPQPEWQPIEMLPTIATMMDAAHEVYWDQVKSLALTFYHRTKWDRPTLHRIAAVHSESLENSWIYEEQFARWKRESLSYDEECLLFRLTDLLKTLTACSESVLSIVEYIEQQRDDDDLQTDQPAPVVAAVEGVTTPPT